MTEGVREKTRVSVWIGTFRLHTLPLALACISLGTLLAYRTHFDPLIAILTFSTAIFLQILSNIANDYGDAKNGADTPNRIGPKRMVNSGLITRNAIKTGIYILIVLSLASGIFLLLASLENIGYAGAMVLFLFGLVSIGAAIAYTATSNPYGYRGLGDISVFLFFGVLAVLGSYYLQVGDVPLKLMLPATGMGMLCTGVLNINNMRDIETDANAHKSTIAVKIGLKNAKIYHWLLLTIPIALFAIYASLSSNRHWIVFIIVSLVLILNGIGVSRGKKPADFVPYLKQLVISVFIFSLLFGINVALG